MPGPALPRPSARPVEVQRPTSYEEHVALLEGVDSAGNVYFTPSGVTAGPSAPGPGRGAWARGATTR